MDTVFFYHQAKPFGQFSNFFMSSFTVSSIIVDPTEPQTIVVESAEQAIMWLKAMLFKDKTISEQLRSETRASHCKRLGRMVRPFNQNVWDVRVASIAEYVLYQKFTSSPELRTLLCSTGTRILAEASPSDSIWGIGITAGAAKKGQDWKGRNLLGSSLMKVRKRLSDEAAEQNA